MAKKKAKKKSAAKRRVAPSPPAGDGAVPEYTYEDEVPLEKLYQDPANARVHGDRNMQAIVSSLRAYGQVEALVVQKSSGQIIGGNGRFDAMRHLGWKKCRVAWVDCTDLQATKLGLMLNRTGDLAETDEELLITLLGKLQDAGEDISDGWTDAEIAKLTELDKDDDLDTDAQLDLGMTYSVMVEFTEEQPQVELLHELEDRGFKCKLLIT